MHRLSTALTLSATALLFLASPALARRRGDSKPIIKQVNDGSNQKVTRAPQGGVVNLVGRNFHKCKEPPEGVEPDKWRCTHEDLKVTVAGQRAIVVASTFDYVTLIIPQNVRPNNRVRIEVSITRRGSASTSIEVVDQKAWKASAKERGSESGGGRDTVEIQVLQSFQITKFIRESGGAGDSFLVEGIAQNVPDKMTVQVDLRYDKQTIPSGTRLLTIKEGKFNTTFGPYSKKLLAGNYSLELMFELGKQSKRHRRKWEKVLSDEERELYGRIQRRGFTNVGTGPGGTLLPEDLTRQQQKLKSHYMEFTKDIAQLRQDVRAAVADAGRSLFKDGRSYDEDRYVFWLTKMGFADGDAKAKEIVDKPKFATSAGHFKHREYLKWAETNVVKKIQRIYEKHRDFNDQYICPMDQKADTLGDYLLSIVLLRFQEWSKDLYKHSGLPLPTSIGSVPVSPVKAPKLSAKFFEAKHRELLRQVGLGSFIKEG